MSKAELRHQIIEKLHGIEDENLLLDIYKLIQMDSAIHEVYQISEDEKEALEMALKDIDAGKTYSSSAADEQLKKWLKK